MLQKFQRNSIFKAIQAVGLDAGQFNLDYSDSEIRIKHKLSVSYYFIGGRSGHYVGNSIIGDGPETPYELYSWDALISRVGLWLQLLKNDLDTPDLWAELRREAELIGGGANKVIENTLFTPDEQKEIARRLDRLAKEVSHALSLSGAQSQALNEKLDYLVKASGRLDRKDWLNAFIGVTLPFVLTVALAPEAARALFLTFLRAIGLLYPELLIE